MSDRSVIMATLIGLATGGVLGFLFVYVWLRVRR